MSTYLDLILQARSGALIEGVGQTPLAEDTNLAFNSLKQMLGQWQKRRWLVYALKDVSAIGNNAVSNQIGVGQYYNVQRPDKINAAFVRLLNSAPPNQVDYPLAIIPSYEDYSRIALKQLNTMPSALFYDAAYPYGNVFVWPIPNDQYSVHLIVKTPFTMPTVVSEEVSFPPEYEEAIWTNLAIRLCAQYGFPAGKELIALAKVSLNTIKNANAQIPLLSLPNMVTGGNSYNVYSDQIY